MATHPVGENEDAQVQVDTDGVLIGLANQPDLRARPSFQLHVYLDTIIDEKLLAWKRDARSLVMY
jgi:hypothetical protein